jgi:hypothetical protein
VRSDIGRTQARSANLRKDITGRRFWPLVIAVDPNLAAVALHRKPGLAYQVPRHSVPPDDHCRVLCHSVKCQILIIFITITFCLLATAKTDAATGQI